MQLDYFLAGKGERALLAFAGGLGAGQTLADVLAQAAPEHRVIAPVYPHISSPAEMLNRVEDILRHESISADVVYGASFGGMFAQAWAQRHFSDTKRLILSGCGGPDPARAARNRKWLARLRWIPMSPVRVALRIALRKMMRGLTSNADSWRRDYMGLIAATGREDFQSRYRVSIDFDENFRPAFESWKGKVLILEGALDRVASPKIRAGLRALFPQATVHQIANAGHSLLLSHPDETLGHIRRFLQEP